MMNKLNRERLEQEKQWLEYDLSKCASALATLHQLQENMALLKDKHEAAFLLKNGLKSIADQQKLYDDTKARYDKVCEELQAMSQ